MPLLIKYKEIFELIMRFLMLRFQLLVIVKEHDVQKAGYGNKILNEQCTIL